MIVFKKLQQFKKMITQLLVCWTIIISKTIIRSLQTIYVNNKHLMLIQKQSLKAS